MSFVAPSSSSHAQASLPTSFAAALRNAAAASKPTPLRTGAQAAPVPVPAAEGQSPRPSSSASASAFDKPAAQPHERRCEDCGKKNPKYHERGDATCRQRWCGPCQRRNHPTAVKARTPRECESPLRHFTSGQKTLSVL